MKKTLNYLNRTACMALLLFAGFAVACGDDKTEEPGRGSTVPVEKIVLSKTSLKLEVGDQQVLTATVSPDNATDKKVVWSSDKPEFATVDQQGKVIAVGAGLATITAAIGEISTMCAVTVEEIVSVVPVEEIELSETSLRLAIGAKQTLAATVKPDNATDKTVVWSSDKTEIVTVDENGQIVAVSAGSATVTAAIGEIKATCAVTVDPKVYVVGSFNSNTAVMWVDGVQTNLTDGGVAAIANDIYIAPSGDIYVVGWDTLVETGRDRAVLWKNGEMTYLSDGTKNTQAKSVFVHGDDVYVAGNEIGASNKVFLWKNGAATVLPSTANYAEVGSMLVSDGGDVYVAGYDNGPTVWKNGVKTGENFGNASAQMIGMAMHGANLYYCGFYNDKDYVTRAMVWKDTQATELTQGPTDCYANAVWVSEKGDVYVAGNQSSSPKKALLWKNSELQTLPDDSYKAFDVAGFGDDLYVAGQLSTGSFPIGAQKAVLWKNGEAQPLCEDKSDARAVFIRVK